MTDFSDLEDLESLMGDLAPVEVKPMGVEYLDPRSLKPNPWNPNQVDPLNLTKLSNSIKKDGIKRPIVVRELENGDHEIIGGQHRSAVAIDLGMDLVPVINRGKISDAEAKKETLLDNYRYGSDDLDRLSALLRDPEIGDAAELLSTMPIDEEELANYFAHLETDDLDAEVEALLEGDKAKEEDDETIDLGASKPVRTHTIIRFRVSIEDQAKIAELLKQVKIDHSYIEADDLTNDGDALVHLLRGEFV